jgi:hypothetical protein
MRNPESKARRPSTFLLVPDAHPLDSRFQGNDMSGYLTPRLTPPQADGVVKRINLLKKYRQQGGILISPADLTGCRKITVSDHQEAMEMVKGL